VAAAPVGDLPVVEVPAHPALGRRMAVVITGDGGWGVTDRGIARTLAAHGVPVVGLNSLRYFWKRRTPDEASADLGRILRHYREAWQADQFVLIGYSLGADVLPFLANRLPADLLDQVRSIVLIGPSREVDFQSHVSDWFGEHARKTDVPVLPEVEKLRGRTLHCFYGDEETGSLCLQLDAGLARIHMVHGGHRIGSRFEAIADTILATMR
jgi:type IV secretory pathway VirJ component